MNEKEVPKSSEPVVVAEASLQGRYKELSLDFLIEDRRPDLEEFPGKFKLYVTMPNHMALPFRFDKASDWNNFLDSLKIKENNGK